MEIRGNEKIVLVGVLKDERDFEILINEGWYRIPADHAPQRKFDYLAFYQPLEFGKSGKQIIYFARVLSRRKLKRIKLIPDEANHPRANDDYVRFGVDKIQKLTRAIKNIIPRRVIFGFTTLGQLYRSKNLLELYSIAPTEQIFEEALKRSGLKYASQRYVFCANKRFRPDFLIFCKNGKVAIECDNEKAHASPQQKTKDRKKDACLKDWGWTVIRFSENETIFDREGCLAKIQKLIHQLGGVP